MCSTIHSARALYWAMLVGGAIALGVFPNLGSAQPLDPATDEAAPQPVVDDPDPDPEPEPEPESPAPTSSSDTERIDELEAQVEQLMEEVIFQDERTSELEMQTEDYEPRRTWSISGYGETRFEYFDTNEGSFKFESYDGFSFNQADMRLNVQAAPDDWVKLLTELRLLYAPSGSVYPTGYVQEYHTLSIERAFFEFRAEDWLQLRLGRFIMPMGLYATDHGAPVYDTTRLPTIYSVQVVPTRQTGLDVFGTERLGESMLLSYNAWLTNGLGEGPADPSTGDVLIVDEWTMIGDTPSYGASAGITLEREGFLKSLYLGAGILSLWEINEDYFVRGFGVELDYSLRKHHTTWSVSMRTALAVTDTSEIKLQAEYFDAFTPQRVREQGPAPTFTETVTEYRTRNYSWYVQAGYEFPVAGGRLISYVAHEQFKRTEAPTSNPDMYACSVGVRWQNEGAWLHLKAQYTITRWEPPDEVDDSEMFTVSVIVFFQ